MTKKIVFSLAIVGFAGLFAAGALAQDESEAVQPGDEQETVSAGILPDSPFYFFKTLGEDIQTFFTFDPLAKAKRHVELAQLRVAEMQAMAEQNKEKNIEKAIGRYQSQLEKSVRNLEKARERNREQEKEKISQLSEAVTQSAEKYNAVLNDQLGELPEKVSLKAREVQDAANNVQIQAIKLLVKDSPEKAVEIFSTALENRLRKIEVGVDYDDTEAADDAVEQYNKYSSFGQEISEMAKGIRAGETTVEELVEKATANHLEVLEQVRARVSEQAKERIDEAIDTSQKVKARIEEQVRNREESGSGSDEGEKNRERNEEQSRTGEEEGTCISDGCPAD